MFMKKEDGMADAKRCMSIIAALVMVLVFFSSSWASDGGKVNINTASAEELATLKRIGPKNAQKIVEYRQTNGLFKRPEEIMNVKGVGEKVWEINKDRIVVGGNQGSKKKAAGS
jgi:competence protein ComEA